MDGKWRALATDMSRKNGFFEMIRDNAVYFGSLYQNEMAVAVKQKEFEIERIHKNGMFKITGFPEDLRDFFSKRRKQIESIIDTMNLAVKNNKKVYDQVAQHSKSPKENINKADFFKKSRDEVASFLKENGYQKSFDSVINECLTKNKTIDGISKATLGAKEAIEDAISYLTQFNTTINANKVLNKAMLFDLGSNSHKDLYHAFESTIQSEKLILTDNGQYTSQYLIQREKNFIELIKTSKNSNCNNKYLNIPKNNTVSQKIADSLLTSRFCIVNESLKQNDKQDFLLDLINDLEKGKKSVKVLSLNKSTENLYNENKKNNQVSIWQKLKSIGMNNVATNVNSFIHQYAFETNLPLNKLFSKKGNEVFIVDQSDRISFDTIQRLIEITKDTSANLVFLKNEAELKNILSGNPLSLIEKCNIPVINVTNDISKKIKNEQVFSLESVNIISPAIGTAKTSNKESVRHQCVLDAVLDQNNKNILDVAIVSYSRNSAAKLNLKLRDVLVQNRSVGSENKKIIVSEPVYLSVEEQKHVKFYPIGSVIKTYVGRGQYETQRVIRHDLNNNKLITENEFRKIAIFSPKEISKAIQNNHTSIVNEKTLLLSTLDRIRVTKIDKFTNQLGFKIDHSYKVVAIGEKNIAFCDENNKTINLRHSKLNGLFLKYDYARSIYDSPYNDRQSVVCEIPLYAINSNLISELKRNYSDINIITDDKVKAQKKISSYRVKHNAIDLKKQGDGIIASSAAKAVDHAISVVGSREAAFTLEDIIEKSLSYKLANTSFQEIKNELIDRVNRNELFFRSIGNQVEFATKEAIELERKIINKIKNGKNQFIPMIDPIKSKQYLELTKLTSGQKAACDLIATTKDQFVMVQGYAGTGKSTMLETLIA